MKKLNHNRRITIGDGRHDGAIDHEIRNIRRQREAMLKRRAKLIKKYGKPPERQ